MTFVYNNLPIIIMTIPMLILIAAFLIVIIKLPKMCLLATPYRPPILPDKFKRLKKAASEDDEDEREVDPDLIQYWPGLFTNNNF